MLPRFSPSQGVWVREIWVCGFSSSLGSWVYRWVRGFVALCFCFWPLWVFVVFVLISCFVWFLLWSLVYVCVFVISLIVCKNSWIFFFFEGEQEETRRRRRDSCFLISWFSFVELESLRLEFHVDFHRNRVFDTRVATVNLKSKRNEMFLFLIVWNKTNEWNCLKIRVILKKKNPTFSP